MRPKRLQVASKIRNRKEWLIVREKVLHRDGYICRWCKHNGITRTINIQVHHIVKITKRYDLAYNEDNLISLCAKCHSLFDRDKLLIDENGKILNKEKTLKEILANGK